MSLLIRNAKIVNAGGEEKGPKDILVDNGLIEKIAVNIPKAKCRVFDAAGRLVFPGLIDLHAHFREPGREDKETIATGSLAAAKGGFTSVFCMPNTCPVIDNAMVVEGIIKEARRVGLINVFPIGAITKGQKGEELTDMFELRRAGCLAISDDGRSVSNTQLMRLAMEYARMVGLLIMDHCQDSTAGCGVMNEGFYSTLLGMKGDPGYSETVVIARDIELARYLKTNIHVCHVSLKRSLELIRAAKKDGVPITCETAPHYFTLTDEEVKSFNPDMKVNPPLRSSEDRDAICKGLHDGTIDCIATDHAPHTREDKEVGFDHAPFGMIGLETALALVNTELVQKKVLDWPDVAARMSAGPAKVSGLMTKGEIAEGKDADLTIFDPKVDWTVTADGFCSKSRNSPFIGRELKGLVDMTVCGGKIVYERG